MRTRRLRKGQAAIEFAIGVGIFAFIICALVEFAPVYILNIQLQSEARCDAGISALGSADGSENLGGAAAFTSRAHPTVEADPWAYPIKNLPQETRFSDWCGDAVSTGRLIPGGRKKDFHIRMIFDSKIILDDDGFLSEELYMPAMGGLKTVGGNM